MGEVVNLNRYRKAKERAEADERAAHNRVKHGRTKAQKSSDKAERDKAERSVEGHKRSDETDSKTETGEDAS